MEFAAILICLLLSGFFSGAEIAFFSITESRLQAMVDEKSQAAQMALLLRRNPQRLLSTILIGNNVVNLTAAALVSIVAFQFFGSEGVAVATGLLTLLMLLFGEIVPKTLCAKHNAVAVRLFAYPIYWIEKIFSPILVLLEPLILKLTGGRGLTVPFATEDELMIMLEAGGESGVLGEGEVKMIKNVFKFTKKLTAEDVMTPLIYMLAMDKNSSLGTVRDDLFKSPCSRIPIYDGNPDNVTGILYLNSALRELAKGNQNKTLKELARPPLFIPGSKPAAALLRQFQQQKRHIAMVVNEFGGVIGLVTTEDLLEEVVGEIVDETDITEDHIKESGTNNTILVNGRTEVRQINERLKVKLDEEEQNTISGLIQQKLGYIPPAGEELSVNECNLTVLEADEKSIKSVQIHKIEEVDPPQPTEPSVEGPSE